MKSFAAALMACWMLTAVCPPARAAEGFEFKEQPGASLDVMHGGKVIARYMNGHDVSTPERRIETYKPYVHVMNAEGTAPITKGPGGQYTHHRGIFIGWNKIAIGGKTYDRWHMKGGDQVHVKFLEQKAGADQAQFTSLVQWMGEGSDVILQEERTIRFLTPPAGFYAMIEQTSVIKAVAGETVLNGDPEHSGLQFRPADEVDKTATHYLYPVENAAPHKDADYPWIAECFTLAGKKYNVVYLNHPENPKGARISAYRDYGRFGLFPTATIKQGDTATFRARVLVGSGDIPPVETIQQAANQYAGKNDPMPRTTALPAEGAKTPKKKDDKKKPEKKPAK